MFLRTKWRVLLLWSAAAVLLAVLCLVGLQMYIARAAAATGDRAARQFGGDRVAALAKLVDCEDCALRERNRAVWALGELANPRALPVLERWRTGQACDHRRALCQYELDKAIKKIQGTWGLLPHIARIRRR